jgi:hypothetical protein
MPGMWAVPERRRDQKGSGFEMKPDAITDQPEKVIFRKFNNTGSIIALFPRIPNTFPGYDFMSYMHVGQHGGCDPSILSITTLATPDEYAELKKELESIGYTLDIVKRIQYEDQIYRMNQLKLIS